MSTYDQLLIYLDSFENAMVYVAISDSFESSRMAEILMMANSGIYILNPNIAYITVLSMDNNL